MKSTTKTKTSKVAKKPIKKSVTKTINKSSSGAKRKSGKKGELVVTRIFDAPRKLVWQAWTDPKHQMRWWGPENCTSPSCKIDLKVGGKYLYCIRTPDGQNIYSTGKYKEIVLMKKLVLTDNFADEKGNVVAASHYGIPGDFPETTITIQLEDYSSGKTRMTLRHSGLIGSGNGDANAESWNQMLDKLAESVRPNADREMFISRLLDAPRDLVFEVWTNPKHIAEWWGPNGFTNTIHEMDVRPGGVWLLTMHGPDGTDYPNKITYVKIKKPELLVYDHGEPGKPGFFKVTVQFMKEKGNKTRISMQGLFDTAEEKQMVVEKYGALEGLKQNMDRLEAFVSKMNLKKQVRSK